MRFHKALIGAAAAAALAIPLSGGVAGAVDSTSLTVVDAYLYSSLNLMGHTVCLNGVVVHDGGEDDPYLITSGISTTPGTHTLVVNGSGDGCVPYDGGRTIDIDLADTAAQTLVIDWPDKSDQMGKLVTTLFTDDVSCTPADTSRIVFRNVATLKGFVGTLGSTDGEDGFPLISNVLLDEEGVASVPAGDFPGSGLELAVWDSNTEGGWGFKTR